MSIPGSASPLFFQTAAGAGAAAGPIESVRFSSGDSAYLNRTPSSAGSNTTWTLSTWVKKTGNDNHIFGAGAGNNPGRFGFGFNGSDKIFAFVIASGSTVFSITTDAVFRDPAGWYHLVLIADTTNGTQADRFKIYVNGVLQSVSGTLMPSSQNTFVNTTAAHTFGRRSYTASDYFNGYLASTILVDGTAKDETDFGAFDDNGVWQAAAYSGSFGTNGFHLFDFANESGIGNDSSGNDNDFTVNNLNATAPLNSGPFTAANAYTGSTNNSYGSSDGSWNSAFNGSISGGVYEEGANGETILTMVNSASWSSQIRIRRQYLHGQVDGWVKLNTTEISGGTSSSQWIDVTSTMGSSGTLTSVGVKNYARLFAIELDGEILNDSATAAQQDVLRDVPTNGDSSDDTGAGGEVSGNYATFNPLMATSEFTYANGNLETSFDAGDNNITVSTIAPKSGKWYAEIVFTASGVANNFYGEVAVADASKIGEGFNSSTSTRYREGSADIYGAGTATGTKSDFAVDDVMGVAVDADNDTVYFYKNNTLEGTVTGLNFDGYAIGVAGNSGTNRTFTAVVNYGQRSWVYSAPSGYKALNTASLPTPTVPDGSAYFDTKLYTGTEATLTVSGYEFSPDLVWRKGRQAVNEGAGITESTNHLLFDTVRGAGKKLMPNDTAAEDTGSTTLTAFTSDGFTLGNSTDGNDSPQTYVAWAWDAGSSTVSNTDGSITSQVRANQTSGFSIVTATQGSGNSTWGHGLNAKPDWIVLKARNQAYGWFVSHSGLDNQSTKFLQLHNANGVATNANWFASTEPTSSVITTKAGGMWNQGDDFLALCWTAIEGFSAFGSYSGNNSADGPFIFTGFRVAWLLIRRSNGSANWYLVDSTRDPDNTVNLYLKPNESSEEIDTGSEGTKNYIDFLSNGFKLRGTEISTNASQEYIYCAFAANPFSSNGGLAR